MAREARYSEATVRNEGHVLRRFAATVTPRPIHLRHLTANHVETWFVSLRRDHRETTATAATTATG